MDANEYQRTLDIQLGRIKPENSNGEAYWLFRGYHSICSRCKTLGMHYMRYCPKCEAKMLI